MNRIHIKDKVLAFLEKSLAPAKHKEIEDHISKCDPCKQFVNDFSAVYFSNDSQECPEVNPYFYTRVLARLENEPENEYILPASIYKSLRPVATGLFLLTTITFSIFFGNYVRSTNQINTNSQVSTANEISYEYYLNNNIDPMVNVIISNEN